MLLLLYTWPALILVAWKFGWQETDKRSAGTLRSYVYNARCSVKQMVWRRLCLLFVLTSCYGPLTFLSHISLLLSILRFLRLNFAPLPLSLSFCRLIFLILYTNTHTHTHKHARARARWRARSLHLVHLLLRYVVYPGREYLSLFTLPVCKYTLFL